MSMRSLPLHAAIVGVSVGLMLAAFAGADSANANQVCESFAEGQWCTSLTPDPDTNPVGADHTVTLNMTHPPGAVDTMAILVYSGPNTGESAIGSPTAGDPGPESHSLSMTYTGDGGTGTDQIIGIVCSDDVICTNMIECIESDPACAQDVQSDCTVDNFNQLTRRYGGGASAGVIGICFGDATASKAWQAVTSSPSPAPTPVDVGGGGQGPSPTPTPAGLPETGGPSGDAGGALPWAAALAAAAAVVVGGSLAARRLGFFR